MLALFLAFAMQALAMTTLDRGDQSHIDAARQAIARTEGEWAALWRQHNPSRPQPAVDFARDTVVAVFLGSRPTAGYRVEIVGVKDSGEGTVVEYRVTQPARDAMTAQILTSPYHIVAVPKRAGTVRFVQVTP